MDYKIKSSNGIFYIYEIATQKLIYSNHDEAEIKSLCKRLNSGAGFNGHTPDFFIRID